MVFVSVSKLVSLKFDPALFVLFFDCELLLLLDSETLGKNSLLEIFENNDLSIINFEVDDEQLLERIKKRSMEESRADDSFFEKRLQIYKKSHLEILNSLKKNYLVNDIQANDEISSVTAKIVDKLELN